MSEFLLSLLKEYEEVELRSIAKILANSYDAFMSDKEIWEKLYTVLSDDICQQWKGSLVGHEAVNAILLNYYAGERIIKYHFAKEHLNMTDEVTLFEMYISSSRLDIGRINGHSYAYEIKTELDTLDRLKRQIYDYMKAFEYVNIIIPKKHLLAVQPIIPAVCGIIQYNLQDDQCMFKTVKKARISDYLDKAIQINSLSLRDLELFLKEAGVKPIGRTKAERQEQALCLSKQKVNSLFKTTLKQKFSSRWSFVCGSFDNILPIDVQTFFNSKADPSWVYYKNSCIV